MTPTYLVDCPGCGWAFPLDPRAYAAGIWQAVCPVCTERAEAQRNRRLLAMAAEQADLGQSAMSASRDPDERAAAPAPNENSLKGETAH